MNIEALAMGGYAGFVWASVLFVLGVLVWNVWAAQRKLSAARLRAWRAQQIKTPVNS